MKKTSKGTVGGRVRGFGGIYREAFQLTVLRHVDFENQRRSFRAFDHQWRQVPERSNGSVCLGIGNHVPCSADLEACFVVGC